MTSTIEYEEAQTRELFERLDEVIDVARAIEGDHPKESERLFKVTKDALSHAAPVRVPIAASVLVVSDKTVRAWVSVGLLVSRKHQPRLLLDAERLYDVLRYVRELRSNGHDRDLMINLWRRLQDDSLLARDDLAASMEQMRAGHTTPALTLQEERKARG